MRDTRCVCSVPRGLAGSVLRPFCLALLLTAAVTRAAEARLESAAADTAIRPADTTAAAGHGVAAAQPSSKSIDSLIERARILRSEALSLRSQAKRLEALDAVSDDSVEALQDSAEQLEDSADNIDDLVDRYVEARQKLHEASVRLDVRQSEMDKYLETEVKHGGATHKSKAAQIKDTVLVLTATTTKDFVRSVSGKKPNSRERGYGGGAALEVGAIALDMGPVNRLISGNRDLRDMGFQTLRRYTAVPMIGGLGYGGLGNGIRIGGGGWGGSHRFPAVRQPRGGAASDSVDTSNALEVSVGMGGFLLEKAFVRTSFNFWFGGYFGGGGMDVLVKRSTASPTIWQSVEQQTRQSLDADETTIESSFIFVELHAGFTYTLVSWLHLGLDVAAPLFISSDGFRDKMGNSLGDAYFTVNPGLRLRIVLGNLG